jgi:hypothetical protein
MMTLTIKISDQQAAALSAKAASQGIMSEVLAKLVTLLE